MAKGNIFQFQFEAFCSEQTGRQLMCGCVCARPQFEIHILVPKGNGSYCIVDCFLQLQRIY